MKLPGRKTKLQKMLDTLASSVDGAGTVSQGLHGLSTIAGRAELKPAVPDAARRTGQVAGGLVGLTALSAGISSYRRRAAETRDRS